MQCWARSLLTVVVIALGTLSMIQACGQKGPLYLPEDKPAHKQAPPPSDPTAPQTPGADIPKPTDKTGG
jgi:predicted small lipoprotein YifL